MFSLFLSPLHGFCLGAVLRVVALCGRASTKLFFDRQRNAKTDTDERMCRTSLKSLAFLFRKIRTTYERTDVQNLDIASQKRKTKMAAFSLFGSTERKRRRRRREEEGEKRLWNRSTLFRFFLDAYMVEHLVALRDLLSRSQLCTCGAAVTASSRSSMGLGYHGLGLS